MSKQVIHISISGEVQGLQMKPGKGIDLRVLGHASIQRVSEIMFDDQEQMWRVVMLQGTLKGFAITPEILLAEVKMGGQAAHDLMVDAERSGIRHVDSPCVFSDYDRAVDFEVRFIQWCETNGRRDLVYD